jgi:hypothetical protein
MFLERMRKFVYERMFSEDRSANDYVYAAVDDLSVQGIECRSERITS